jgi:hypothetical protein
MRTYKKITHESLVIDNITCNKCGNDCRQPDAHNSTELSAVYHTNYDNNILPDVTTYYFDICEKCLVEFMGTFKIEAETQEQLP